jgi:hypothetical protein
MTNNFRPTAYGCLATVLATSAIAIFGAGAAGAAPVCNNDVRGNTICLRASHGHVFATGSWGNANNLPYIEIVDADSGAIIAGPVADTHIDAALPHGHYFASYFVISDTSGATSFSVDSPTIEN